MLVPKNSIEPVQEEAVEPAGDDRSVSGDEVPHELTSGGPNGPAGRSFVAYGGVALVVVASWLVNSLSTAHDAAMRGGAYDLLWPLFFEGTSALAVLLLLPLMRRGTAVLGASRNWVTALGNAVLLVSIYALLHVAFMVLLRKLAFAGMGRGYAFQWGMELPYEIRKDTLSAALIGVAFWLLDRKPRMLPAPVNGEAAGRGSIRPGETPKPELWLRDGMRSIRVDARDIVSVTSAGNYVEFSLPGKRSLIRGTLAREEARLKPFGLRRVHRTSLANLNHVVALELRSSGDFLLRMDNGETIAGSRRYKDATMEIRASAHQREGLADGGNTTG